MIIREAKTNKKTKVAVKKSNKSKNEATTSAMVSTPQGGFRDKEDGFIVIKCPNCGSEYINIHDDGDMFYCSTCGNLWPVDSYKGETGKAVKEAVKREMRKRRRIHNKDIAFPTYDEVVEYCLDNKIELSNITQDSDTDDYIVCIENPIEESYNFINEAVNKKTWSKVNSSLTAYIGMDKSDIKNLKSFFDYIYDYVEDVCGGFYEGKVNYDERPEFVVYSWSIQGKKPFKRFDINNVVKRIKSRLADFKVVNSGTYKIDGREWPFRLIYEPKDSEYMHDITIGLDFMADYDESGKDDKYKINVNSDGPLVDFLIVINKDENIELNNVITLDNRGVYTVEIKPSEGGYIKATYDTNKNKWYYVYSDKEGNMYQVIFKKSNKSKSVFDSINSSIKNNMSYDDFVDYFDELAIESETEI